jgi:hypothetical protein
MTLYLMILAFEVIKCQTFIVCPYPRGGGFFAWSDCINEENERRREKKAIG